MSADPGQAGHVIDAVFAIVRGTERRDVALASYLDAAGEERALIPLTAGSRACVTRASTAAPAAAVHVSRRLVVVVRGAVPAQAAGHPRALHGARGARNPHRARTAAACTGPRQPAGARSGATLQWRRASLSGPAGGGRQPCACRHGRAGRGAQRRGARVAAAHARRRAPARRCRPPGVRPSRVLARRLGAKEAPKRTSGRCSRRSRRASAQARSPTSASARRRTSGPAAGGTAARARGAGMRFRRSRRTRRSPRSRESRRIWRERHRTRRALWQSDDLRDAAVIRAVRLLADRSRGAGRHRAAAVAVVGARDGRSGGRARRARPAVAVTYAEAGGWGRAIVLECRRRGIPSVGLQHGFIYRHWLNYLHEPDEMPPDPASSRRSRLPAVRR